MSPKARATPRRFALILCAAAALAGCAARNAMDRHAKVEDPWVDSQPYPRLVDSPEPPPPGEFNAATPDPARGQAIIDELGPIAQENTIRGAALSGQPVLDPEFEQLMRDRGALPAPSQTN